MTGESQQHWPGFKYEQVRGLVDRHIARYLRTQRKNMARFFAERGLMDLAYRMRQIRDSRTGMLAKNRQFQKVLNDYAKLVTPAGEAPATVSEAPPDQIAGSPDVEVQNTDIPPAVSVVGDSQSDGPGKYDEGSIHIVESEDGIG